MLNYLKKNEDMLYKHCALYVKLMRHCRAASLSTDFLRKRGDLWHYRRLCRKDHKFATFDAYLRQLIELG